MLLLVTDTSGKNGFVGLVRVDEAEQPPKIEVIEEVALAGGTFSAQLVPQISGLLKEHGLRKTDLDAFVVVAGPGSFTGLRVGLSAIKALAEILEKPIVAVSLLEAVARSIIWVAGDDASVCYFTIALDAGRGEAFVGRYEMTFVGRAIGALRCLEESLLGVQPLAELLQSGATPWIATPDAGLAESLSQRLDLAQKRGILIHPRPRSAEVAAVGILKLRGGEIVSPEQLDANYIRRSDAEIFSKPNL